MSIVCCVKCLEIERECVGFVVTHAVPDVPLHLVLSDLLGLGDVVVVKLVRLDLSIWEWIGGDNEVEVVVDDDGGGRMARSIDHSTPLIIEKPKWKPHAC
eukprot:2604502-Amphidinium_carterae.1